MLPDLQIWECNGSKYILFDRKDIIADSLKTKGIFGEDVIKLSLLLCEGVDTPLILDIGANLGSYAIPVGIQLMRRGGEVYAYEPQRIPFYQLCANVLLNRLNNIVLHNIALGNENSEVQIHDMDEGMWNSGAYSLVKEFRQAEGIDHHLSSKTNPVKLCTLDDMVFSRPVNLIKMDVEGYEIHVIEGGEGFLEAHNYPYVIFEAWDSPWYLERKNLLFQKFFNLGYEIKTIDATNFLAQHRSSSARLQIS